MRCFDFQKWAPAAIALIFAAGLQSAVAKTYPANLVISKSMTMYAGQALVRTAPKALKRVAVGNGKLVEVRVLDHKQMVIIANHPGDTSLQLWMKDGTQRSVSLHIVAGNTGQTTELVRKLLAHHPNISVATVGGNVVLTGSNLSQADLAQIASIRKVYPQVLDFTTANAVQMKPMVMMKVRIMGSTSTP